VGRQVGSGESVRLGSVLDPLTRPQDVVATSGSTWRLPPVFGPAWPTVYRRFAQWSKGQVWLHRVVLDKLGSRGEPDWSPAYHG
jgi:hypothetical protein